MQHIAHIFIGNEMAAFRDRFASTFHRLHSEVEPSLFSAILLTENDDGLLSLQPDQTGDPFDKTHIAKDSRATALYNYFEDMYSRKVTVAHPGNHSLIVVIWTKLYSGRAFPLISDIAAAINSCSSNIHAEVAGFSHDAVSCFIPEASERLAPDIYKGNFEYNLAQLRKIRSSISAVRLIANRNMDNVSLDLDEDAMARVCAEYSALMCGHYLSTHPTVIDSQEYPFESFGVSSIIFDIEYYKTYIRNRIIIDKSIQQGVDRRSFNINNLAQSTNPILQEILQEIHDFYRNRAVHAKASLSLIGNVTASNIVGTIDKDLKEIISNLKRRIEELLTSGKISIFECEALLALVLGDDCSMFDSSAVNADETIIDDIINESADFFINLDIDKSRLLEVSQSDIKKIRSSMRNIAMANRKREERLAALKIPKKESASPRSHLDSNGYRFGETDYRIDLHIDTEPLEQTYQPHDVRIESVDLRSMFTPIRNQGHQGSCASFAVASVIEAMRRDSCRYSPAFLYWTARNARGETSKDSGASLYEIINAATEKGTCSEESMPYNQGIFSTEPSETAIDEALKCRIIEAKTVTPNLKDIKSALTDGYPVIVAARIFDSFSDTLSGFVQHPSAQELSDGERVDGHGNHAMVVCGFSDKEKVLVVRNSWGTGFGENGYCYLPYSYAQKYFLQACIITELSSSSATNTLDSKKTINFNMSDGNIEAAILQNLIEEDQFELDTLAEESARLKTDWTQNVATLGNVNKQAEIVKEAQDALDKLILSENETIAALQLSKNDKLSEFKRIYRWNLLISSLLTIFSWLIVYCFPTSTGVWITSAIITIFTVGLFASFGYRWRKFRQDLRDEILRHSNNINRIQEEKASLDIKSHIHGTILKDVEDYRLSLLSQYRNLQAFNIAWLELYKDCNKEQRALTPSVPYPFLAVLDNQLLDRYYDAWKDKMTLSIGIESLYGRFSPSDNLADIVKSDEILNKAVVRGLKNFSMKEFITQQNLSRWQFLPDTTKMSEIMPDLDFRAKPFYPCNRQENSATEKYIFIKDIRQDEMAGILPYFSQAPMPMSDTDPYSICVLNIVRYNL